MGAFRRDGQLVFAEGLTSCQVFVYTSERPGSFIQPLTGSMQSACLEPVRLALNRVGLFVRRLQRRSWLK